MTTAKKTSSKKKKSSASGKEKQGSRRFKFVILSLVCLIVIMTALIIHLDQKAIQQGQIGLWEMITKTQKAHSAADVDHLFKETLARFGVSNADLSQEGTTADQVNKTVRHAIYKIQSKETWLDLAARFEDEVEMKGVRVYNRFYSKNVHLWNLTFFLGTAAERTHKIELRLIPGKPVEPAPSEQPAEPTAVPDTTARIALVFDDFGADKAIAMRFIKELNYPITLAVLPFQTHTSDIIKSVRAYGRLAFLHLPMEPDDRSQMKEKEMFLTTDMNQEAIHDYLTALFESIPVVDGVNNHTGSNFTADKARMRTFLGFLKERKLPFLDSRTTAKSVGYALASELGLKTAQRDVFLDQGSKGGDVAANLDELVAIAGKKGFAIGIGHAQVDTLEILKEKLPEVVRQGVRIVPVTDLMTE